MHKNCNIAQAVRMSTTKEEAERTEQASCKWQPKRRGWTWGAHQTEWVQLQGWCGKRAWEARVLHHMLGRCTFVYCLQPLNKTMKTT